MGREVIVPLSPKERGFMKTYRCIRKCFHNVTKDPKMATLYLEGQVVNVEDDVEMPKHFEQIELIKQAPKSEPKTELTKELSEKDQIEAIYAEMDSLGKAYDRRWGLKRMISELALAKKGM